MNQPRKIAYFAGCTANFVEPEIGLATVRVLRWNGLEPAFPAQDCCGLSELLGGNVRSFQAHGGSVLRSLDEAEGDIVTACTSCALALKQEYPRWIGTAQAERVARRTYDILEYLVLLGERKRRETRVQTPADSILYHAPCHLRVLGRELVEGRLQLMRKASGGRVREADRGCCGMGGTFGLKKSNYALSMAIGQALFERVRESGADLVATDCPGCKVQIEQGTGLAVTHPILILERALGPEKTGS